NSGINSPPILVKITTHITKSATEPPTTILADFKTEVRSFSYHFSNQLTALSPQLFFPTGLDFKNKEETAGTYVRHRIIAPSMAKIKVSAIGLNIFPSTPSKVRIGRKIGRASCRESV